MVIHGPVVTSYMYIYSILSLVPSHCVTLSWQANTLRPYLNSIQSTLKAALCLRNFPSQNVERHNKPEVEVRYVPIAWVKEQCLEPSKYVCVLCHFVKAFLSSLSLCRANKELLLNPVTIYRNEKERIFIEPSVNSVRVSILIKQVGLWRLHAVKS